MESKFPQRGTVHARKSFPRCFQKFLTIAAASLCLSSFAAYDNGWEYEILPGGGAVLTKAKYPLSTYVSVTNEFYPTIESLELLKTNFEWRVQIPATLGGEELASIGEEAFYDYHELDYGGNNQNLIIVLPETVTSIGDRAFGYCTGIRNVEMPTNHLVTIGKEAFAGCCQLVVFESVDNWS